MKPYTMTRRDPEQLRRNWRGNRCSKGRNGDSGGKGRFKTLIGNSNYRRKAFDRINKKRYRRALKRELSRLF